HATLDVDIAAPQPKPPGVSGVGFIEDVIPATNFQTMTEGHRNAAGAFDGAQVTVTTTGIHVHATVQGHDGLGAPGKFGALYRVFWTAAAAPPAPVTRRACPADPSHQLLLGSCSLTPAPCYSLLLR